MPAQFQVISFGEAAPKVREQKKRKFHSKTRAGCIGCKTKRVKVGSEAAIEHLLISSSLT